MYISDDVYEASIDALGDITEVGSVVKLLVPKKIQSVGNTDKDIYSEMYGQTQNADPEIEKEYELHSYVTYNPSKDELLGAGLDEKCEIMVMFATYELFQNGFADIEGDFHTILTNLKRNLLIEHNGKKFLVKEVGMTATLNAFSIICNLGCDVYV